MTLDRDAAVRHPRFGPGQIVLARGDSVVVRFGHGIEECLAADLEPVEGLAERMAAERLDPALHVVTRVTSGSAIFGDSSRKGSTKCSRFQATG